MNNEQKSEIIKSFALGMTAEQIAAVENITVEEAQQITCDCADEISRKRRLQNVSGGLKHGENN